MNVLRASLYAYRLLAGDDPHAAAESVARLEGRLAGVRERAESMMRDALHCTRSADCNCPICREDRS